MPKKILAHLEYARNISGAALLYFGIAYHYCVPASPPSEALATAPLRHVSKLGPR